MRKSSTGDKKANAAGPSFRERLTFAIWLSAKTLGTASKADLAAVLKKKPAQLSNWLAESPRPEFENIKLIADAVGISASWLDDPSSSDAREPADFAEWFSNRRARAAQRRGA